MLAFFFFSRNNWDFSTSQTITPVRNAICIHTNFCDLDQSCYSNWEESRRENDWFMLLWIRSDTGRYKPVNSVLLSIATYTSERCIQRLFLQLSMAVCNCHLLYQYCYITTIIATIKSFSVIWFDGDGGGTGDSMGVGLETAWNVIMSHNTVTRLMEMENRKIQK